jgi:hypothetical protein
MALKFKGGVIIAADTNISYGGMKKEKDARRIFKLNDECAMACSGEMADAQKRLASGNSAAQRDIDALVRESKGQVQPQPQQASGQTLADLWESTPASTAKQEQKKNELPLAAQFYNKRLEGKQALGEKIVGAGEAGLTALSGGIAAPVSALGGVVGTLASGQYGTPQGIQAGQDMARRLQEGGTYQPRTQQGQQYVQNLQRAFEASKLPPVGVPEVAGFAPLAGPAMQQAKAWRDKA